MKSARPIDSLSDVGRFLHNFAILLCAAAAAVLLCCHVCPLQQRGERWADLFSRPSLHLLAHWRWLSVFSLNERKVFSSSIHRDANCPSQSSPPDVQLNRPAQRRRDLTITESSHKQGASVSPHHVDVHPDPMCVQFQAADTLWISSSPEPVFTPWPMTMSSVARRTQRWTLSW